MSITAVNSSASLQVQTPSQVIKKPETTKSEAQSPQIQGDSVEIKKGLWPGFKGAGAGFLIGGAGGMGTAMAINAATNMGSGALALLGIPMVAAPAGLVAGAVTANITDSPGKGTLVGAAAGAAVGAAVGASMGNLSVAAWTTGIGAAAGALSGLASSFIAERQ